MTRWGFSAQSLRKLGRELDRQDCNLWCDGMRRIHWRISEKRSRGAIGFDFFSHRHLQRVDIHPTTDRLRNLTALVLLKTRLRRSKSSKPAIAPPVSRAGRWRVSVKHSAGGHSSHAKYCERR